MAAPFDEISDDLFSTSSSQPIVSTATPNTGKRPVPFSPEDLPASLMQINRQTRRKGNSVGDLSEIAKPKATRKSLTEKIQDALSSPEVLGKIIPLLSEKIAEHISTIIEPHVQSAVETAVEPLKKQLDKQDQVINALNERLCKQCVEVHTLKREVIDYSLTVQEYEKEIDRMTRIHNDLETRMESMEQYSRRTSLRFHNIKVPVDEQGQLKHPIDTDNLILEVCNQKLGLSLTLADISRSHDIGKVKNGRSQVIVRFISYRNRNAVYTKKKQLKNDPDKIFVTENLTEFRTNIVKHLSKMRYNGQIYTYWTSDGRIFVKTSAMSRTRNDANFEDLRYIERLINFDNHAQNPDRPEQASPTRDNTYL